MNMRFLLQCVGALLGLIWSGVSSSYADAQPNDQTVKVGNWPGYGPKQSKLANGNIIEIKGVKKEGAPYAFDKEYATLKRSDGADVNSKFSFDCSWSDEQSPCFTVALTSGMFLIVDCIMHDSTFYSCRLIKFLPDGINDKSFQPVLGWKGDHWSYEDSKDDIMGVSEVALLPNNQLRLKGWFNSKLLNPKSDKAVEAEVILNANGSLASSKVIRETQE